jgi:transglutaminase-like putative cysteine protease
MALTTTLARVWRPAAALPRESRDTLFLLAVIGWTVLPHLGHLPLWCSLVTLGVLAWRARLAWTNGPLPGRWVLVAVLGTALALTYLSYRTLLGRDAGVTLVVVLMALKTLELRARRDAFVVFFLGFFLVLTHFLYSQNLLVAGSTLLSVWGLLTALVLAHMPVGQPSLATAAVLAGRTAAFGAPIMVLLFLLFPRFGPLWGVPQDGRAATGLSDTMEIGSITEVAQDDRIAMRVRFVDPAPPPAQLYFRGPVLGQFDGRQWRRLEPTFGAADRLVADLEPSGTRLRYEITLEPTRLTTVPVLDGTLALGDVDGQTPRMGEDLQWTTRRPIFQRVRYEATADPALRHGPKELVLGLQDYLSLPAGYNPRTLAWAADLRRRPDLATAEATALARVVMDHVRTAGFSYTLSPGTYGDAEGRHAIDEFWLDRRAGFCEHFAAAFVVVMRALDVPARVVTGYQGSDPAPVDGYVVVRNSTAHAWAEFWQPGVGWVRADPTAAIAPDRVARSLALRPAPGLVAGAFNAVDPALLARLRQAWEMLDNRWNQWVLGYSRNEQFDLLRHLGWKQPDWEDLGLLLGGTIGALSLAGALWAWWDRRREPPWPRLLAAMRRALRRIDLPAGEHEPPRQLARRVRERWGPAGEPVAALLEELDALRYGRQARTAPPREWRRRLDAATRRLASAPPPR